MKTMFETTIIFKPDINLQEKLREYEQIFKATTDHIYLNPAGIKKLSYKVREYTTGHYVQFYYNSTTHWVSTNLDLVLRKDDDVLKFLNLEMAKAPSELTSYNKISLSARCNKHIDALDVLLGLTSYYEDNNKEDNKKEVI